MKKSLKTEILENMSVFSAILDVLSLDMGSLFQMTGYRSQNAQRLDSLIKESKRGLENLKQLIEKENEMEFDKKPEKTERSRKSAAAEPEKAAKAAPEVKGSAEKAAPNSEVPPNANVDEFGMDNTIPKNIREELHRVLIALNNVATYAMDQFTVSNRVFAKYIAGLYNIEPQVIFQALEQESLILQKMHEREAGISDAETVGEKNDGNTK